MGLDKLQVCVVHLDTMIMLNINDLLKFMLESIANYASVLIITMMCFFLLTSFVTIVVDKLTNMVGTWIMIYKGNTEVKIEKNENND